jgi:hypothetical protein
MLSSEQVEQFIQRGFVKIGNAFSRSIASQARDLLWKKIDLDPGNPSEWTRPVIRLGEMSDEPFSLAVNTPALLEAFDQLAGDNWVPRHSLGSFPIRFPSQQIPGDTGWHVDASFPGKNPGNYLEWRINFNSRGRALLMLFLFSDVGEDDAPTRLKEGSHFDVAKILSTKGDDGLSCVELAEELSLTTKRKECLATGEAGTVFLCHPFLVHAAQVHRGKNPKFMAQPPLISKRDFQPSRPFEQCCAVEKAIQMAMHEN